MSEAEIKMNTRQIRKCKFHQTGKKLQMLTCYDFQTAQLLSETSLNLILVGDSLGNVVLGHENTIKVNIEEMVIFSKAVRRGARNKFIIADLPFGSYKTFSQGLDNASKLFQESGVEAVKLEGAYDYQLDLIKRLTEIGVPVMGHIGLTPQSVHEMGGYYTHGKEPLSANKLIEQAKSLEHAGAFAVVLECVHHKVAKEITKLVNIPIIGIGSGDYVDGHVLVLNDLLGNGKDHVPSFVTPKINLYEIKKKAIDSYLNDHQDKSSAIHFKEYQ